MRLWTTEPSGYARRQAALFVAVYWLVSGTYACSFVADESASNCDDRGPSWQVCANSCVDTSHSSEHCGACNAECPTGQICTMGECVRVCSGADCAPSCPEHETACGDTCAVLSDDPEHCGGCDAACAAGQTCEKGQCKCPDGLTWCDDQCVDTNIHPSHCGRCNAACDNLCSLGQCVDHCAPGEAQCGNSCTVLDDNREHCGECNKACGTGQLCSDGACACPDGLDWCGDECVDTRFSPEHCGDCNSACEPGEFCTNGGCSDGCAANETACGRSCVELSNNREHCGACDKACDAGQVCVDGDCRCPAGFGWCDGACVDVHTSSEHCGDCDRSCNSDESCLDGVCEMVCVGGTTRCGEECVNTSRDPLHCGGCDEVCASGEVCSADECDLRCGGGTTDCSGFCIDTDVDPVHCGGCDRPCPDGLVCSEGVCAPSCGPPTTACDGECVDILRSAAHCGGCGRPCPEGNVCQNGACSPQCGPGTELCDGECRNFDYDPTHCGNCGNECRAGEVCFEGDCASNCGTGLTDCDGSCVDLDYDPVHCGGCNGSCTYANAIAACVEGECVLGGCVPGFGDADRETANGCECKKTEDSRELCDGKDNDCDGLVDAVRDGGPPESVCSCDPEELSVVWRSSDEDQQHPECTTNQCSILEGGVAGLASMDFCCNADGAWSQCVLAQRPGEADQVGFDLNRFDADNLGRGVLEVVVRLEEAMASVGLSLWYGDYPYRKKLVLLTAEETAGGTGPQTLSRYLHPADALCPVVDAAVLRDFPDFPAECFITTQPDTPTCPDGVWSHHNPDRTSACAFDYSNSWLYLTAESCAGRVDSVVTLVSVRYFERPLDCACESSSSCADGETCQLDAAIDTPWCPPSNPSCAGLCSPSTTSCENAGKPCGISMNGAECKSVITCVGEVAVCPIPDACGG